MWCPRSDSNGDALTSTGPQPAVYTNSTTGALHLESILFIAPFVKK